tara:strand:- start:189 stop:578 length:390 start_codon:yes stop_codon:yes gene_type:complete
MPEKGKVKIFEDYKKKRKDRLDKAEASKGLKATFKQLKKPNREIDSPTTFRDDSPLMKMAGGSPLFNFPGKAAWTADQQSKPVNKRFDGTYEDAKRADIRKKSKASMEKRIAETGNSSDEETFTKGASA